MTPRIMLARRLPAVLRFTAMRGTVSSGPRAYRATRALRRAQGSSRTYQRRIAFAPATLGDVATGSVRLRLARKISQLAPSAHAIRSAVVRFEPPVRATVRHAIEASTRFVDFAACLLSVRWRPSRKLEHGGLESLVHVFSSAIGRTFRQQTCDQGSSREVSHENRTARVSRTCPRFALGMLRNDGVGLHSSHHRCSKESIPWHVRVCAAQAKPRDLDHISCRDSIVRPDCYRRDAKSCSQVFPGREHREIQIGVAYHIEDGFFSGAVQGLPDQDTHRWDVVHAVSCSEDMLGVHDDARAYAVGPTGIASTYRDNRALIRIGQAQEFVIPTPVCDRAPGDAS
jgi:hypothetical protein